MWNENCFVKQFFNLLIQDFNELGRCLSFRGQQGKIFGKELKRHQFLVVYLSALRFNPNICIEILNIRLTFKLYIFLPLHEQLISLVNSENELLEFYYINTESVSEKINKIYKNKPTKAQEFKEHNHQQTRYINDQNIANNKTSVLSREIQKLSPLFNLTLESWWVLEWEAGLILQENVKEFLLNKCTGNLKHFLIYLPGLDTRVRS